MDILHKNLLVLASAGSGKTFCLSDRIIGLIAGGVEPEKIVALTFTRKAAGEFTDAILIKLADAAEDPENAERLRAVFGSPEIDFAAMLEKTIRRLPKLTLGTMDSFFSKIVRGFQHELGIVGGNFELLEGEVAAAMRDEIMETLLDEGTGIHAEDDLVEIFRRANEGKEAVEVLADLRKFVDNWHRFLLSPDVLKWGPAELAGVDRFDWEKHKEPMIEAVRRDLPNIHLTDKRQTAALEKMMDAISAHGIGSGSLNEAGSLLKSVMNSVAEGDGDGLQARFQKDFTIAGIAAQELRKLLELAARCEFAAALSRTRGIFEIISAYDLLIEKTLRGKGRLGFDDVKRLMGQWMTNEDSRLIRERIDFRLDSNYHHWMLDEFQDTSRTDWNALLPLIDEGITNDESTVFIVGDKKQAIYAWRGGEVGLFDEVINHYGRGEGIKVETMIHSWRSCPQVLDLVNRVCGDKSTMREFFGDVVESWDWQDHVSAERLTQPDKAGHSRVEIIAKDEKAERVIRLLREIGISQKKLSCGILVPVNKDVTEWADLLRAEGFQVIEEGAREPAKDHPVGIMIWQLLRWLADPSDSFAEQTVRMSPLQPILVERYGESHYTIWNGISHDISENGFAECIESLCLPLLNGWQDFGKMRFEDLIQALEKIDREGIILAREAADRIGRLKISQSPGVAAVQVMTIHKSKGLGFDVVILPDVPDIKIPDKKHLHTLVGDDWLSDVPTGWARNMIPVLRDAELSWERQQTYDSFCKLYVALTRAKRGLYVFLDERKPSKDGDERATLSNWIATSLELDRSSAESVFESGEADWHANISPIPSKPLTPSIMLGMAITKRPRTTPSSGKDFPASASSGSGRAFGSAAHHAFEQIGWLDESPLPAFPEEVRSLMEKTISIPEIRTLLSKSNRSIRLLREQSIEAIVDGKWLSGVIDRLHLHENSSGEITLVEIIDFKTDKVASAEDLKLPYSAQMEDYRHALQLIHPKAEIRCVLVSTSLGKPLSVSLLDF